MKPIAIEILTSSAFPIVTLLFGFLIGNRLAIGRDDLQKIKQTVDRFRSSFIEVIHDLKTTQEGVSFGLSGILEEHEKARNRLEIELNLSRRRKRRLDKIWDKYRENTKTYYNKLSGHDPDTSLKWRATFLSEIETMLKNINKIT